MRTLTVVYGETALGGWHLEVIDEYGRTTGQLCFGELLEQIAGMAHRRLGQPPYPMHTPEAWARRHEESIARGAANRAASLSRLGRIEAAATRLRELCVSMDADIDTPPPSEADYQAAMAELEDALDAPF